MGVPINDGLDETPVKPAMQPDTKTTEQPQVPAPEVKPEVKGVN